MPKIEMVPTCQAFVIPAGRAIEDVEACGAVSYAVVEFEPDGSDDSEGYEVFYCRDHLTRFVMTEKVQ